TATKLTPCPPSDGGEEGDCLRIPLPMNLRPTNPPLTPPRRGTAQAVLLPSWEGLGVGSGAQCAHKVRSIPRSSPHSCVAGRGRKSPLQQNLRDLKKSYAYWQQK